MKLNRGLVALYVIVIFGCGTVLGFYGHRFQDVSSVSANAARNPDEFRRQYMAEMKTRLKLSQDQATQLSTILDETRARFRTTRDSIEPELRRIRENQQARISAILSQDQQAEYDKIRAERDARMKKGKRPARP